MSTQPKRNIIKKLIAVTLLTVLASSASAIEADKLAGGVKR
ncbi:MAG: hypothetical protein ABL867_01420 [Rickettsiales bacterium]